MSDLFLTVFNMSISAIWALLAVLFLRLVLKKAPKRITVLLWCIVGLRLVMPFSVESIFCIIPGAETVSKAWDSPRPSFNSGIAAVDSQVNGYLKEHWFEGVTRPTGYFTDITTIAAVIWIIGIAALAVYTAVSFLRLKKRVGTAVILRDNVYQSENVTSPFVLGIIKPKIYLPFNMTGRDCENVILHEKAHISRNDCLWKPLGFILLSVHWFNPLMWLAYMLFCRDIELACDEKAVSPLNAAQRADYSEALLNCGAGRHMLFAGPPAFGEVGVKDRVKYVLKYKKPALWIAATAIIAGIIASACLLTNPKSKIRKPDGFVIRDSSISAECDDIIYDFVSSTYEKNNLSVTVKWTNNRKDALCFGDEFKLYKNSTGETCKQKSGTGFTAKLNVVKPGGNTTEVYNLSAYYDIEEKENYRLEKIFYLKNEPEKKYKAEIVFSADAALAEYIPEKAAYTNSFSSLAYKSDTVPCFKVDNLSFWLLKKEPSVSEWEKVTDLQPIKLQKANFDEYFSNEIWAEGLSARKIRKDNLHAFSGFDTDGHFYCLLEQKNGDIYIAQSGSVYSDFEWMFKMKPYNENANVNLGWLRNAVYPNREPGF